VSTNVTVTVKEAVAGGFTPSEAVQFTVVVPTGNVEPDGGLQLTTGGLPLSSVAETEYVTTAPVPDVLAEMLAGTVNEGGSVSANVTVTVKEDDPVFEWLSVALQVTVVTVTAKLVPDCGLQLTATLPSTRSVAVGVA
jgi:hypothetical protein